MSSIYTSYISRIATNHFHLCEISNKSGMTDDGYCKFSGRLCCVTKSEIQIISNLDHLSESEIQLIIQESKITNDDFKILFYKFINDVFDNLNRLISLISKNSSNECLLVYVRPSSSEESSSFVLISISKGGVKTEVTINLKSMLIKINSSSNNRFNTIEHEKERHTIHSLMNCFYISQEAFDAILAYCITVLRHCCQLLRYSYDGI